MIEPPYLLFLGDAADALAAKVAQGIRDWRPDAAIGQYRMEGCNADMGLPDMTHRRGRGRRGADAGRRRRQPRRRDLAGLDQRARPRRWRPGMDLASGLHNLLRDEPELVAAAMAHGRKLHDVRVPPHRYPIANGKRRQRQALPRRRHRLLGRQDVHRARHGAGDARARHGGDLPRHRPDRHPDHRRRRAARRRGRRLHGRLDRVADARQRPRPLGPDRGPGQPLPPLLLRRDAGADPRRPARRAGALPRADAAAHARPARLRAALARGAARPLAGHGAHGEPGRARHRRLDQHRRRSTSRRRSSTSRRSRRGWACRPSTPSARARRGWWTRSPDGGSLRGGRGRRGRASCCICDHATNRGARRRSRGGDLGLPAGGDGAGTSPTTSARAA